MSGLLTERIKAANKKKGILDIWGELKRGFNNNPRNAETMDAIFGLGGIVPGVGDAASGAEALYRYNQGDMLGSGLAGLGALPMVPSMAGMIKTQYGRIPESYADTKKLGDMLERAGINAGHVVQREGSAISPSQYLTFGEGDAARQVRLSNHADKNKMMAGATPRMSVDPETGNTYEQAINWLAENGYNTPLSAKYKAIPSWEQHYANMAEKSKNPEELLQKAIDAWRNKPKATRGPMPTIEQVIPTTNAKSLLSMDGMVASKGVKAIDAVRPRNALGQEIPPTPYELAHMEAQRNAALPVEQGGLGLPQGNTAMDRAMAMYPERAYHGSYDDILEFDPSLGGKSGFGNSANTSDFTTVPDVANQYAMIENAYGNVVPGGAIYPVNIDTTDFAKVPRSLHGDDWMRADDMANESTAPGMRFKNTTWDSVDEIKNDQFKVIDPSRIRSRFAAFDPMKRDSADLLAGVLPYAAVGGLLGYGMYDEPDYGGY